MDTRFDLSPLLWNADLSCDVSTAFATYVERIGEWWHPMYTANPDTFETVTIEPAVGGRIVERHTTGETHDWGEVLVFQRDIEIAHTFTLAQPDEVPSRVDVRFHATRAGCEVELTHGGWTPENGAYRAKFTDWALILDRFVALTA